MIELQGKVFLFVKMEIDEANKKGFFIKSLRDTPVSRGYQQLPPGKKGAVLLVLLIVLAF